MAGSATPLWRLVIPALGVLLGLVIAAGAARASVIVYQCGPAFENLCRITPDGSGQAQLTADGSYSSPSLSRDGTRLAFVRGSGELFTADADAGNRVGPISHSALLAYLSPDGSGVADLESFGLGEPVALCTFLADGSGRDCPASTVSAGWAPGNRLLISTRELSGEPSDTAICLLVVGSYECERYVAHDPNLRLYDPTVSPDGSTLAVTAVPVSAGETATRGSIALFDYATGAFRGYLTQSGEDGAPTWSPDGAQIAFARGSSIYVTAATGSPGSEHALVAGESPSWGGSSETPPCCSPESFVRITRLKLNRFRGTAKLSVHVSGPGQLVLTGPSLKRVKRAVRRAGRVTLPVKPKGKTKRRLARTGRAQARLVLAFTPDGGATVRLRRQIRLRSLHRGWEIRKVGIAR